MSTPLVALTVAGTDSGGAAGVAADLTTFAALGVHGACAVTAVTAQDTVGVRHVVQLTADDVRAQVDAVLEDLPVAVVKTGMLGTEEVADVVVDLPPRLPLVVDPVLVATSGAELADAAVVAAYRHHVLARATVVTPNLDEALQLTGAGPADPREDVALALHAFGPAVVLTGGDPEGSTCRDVVVDGWGRVQTLEHAAVPTTNDHGTGCTLSAAIAALRPQRADWLDSVREAKRYLTEALRASERLDVGHGHGPVHHFHQWW